MSLLTAVALIVFIIEAQIPPPVPIYGAKLGLSNTVTLFALYCDYGKPRSPYNLTTANVLLILVCRIILGSILTGRAISFLFSLSGGLLGFAALVVMKRILTQRVNTAATEPEIHGSGYRQLKQIWVCSAFGAVFHNVGQIITAIFVTGTLAIAAYLPVLIIVGIITGVLTGLVAQFALQRLNGKI